MRRWIALPLVAAAALVGSGFAGALDRTTHETVQLATTAARAPGTTGEAARSLGTLPDVSRLTQGQVTASRTLATALEVSARRVDDLNGALADQTASLRRLHRSIVTLLGPMACIRQRAAHLLRVSSASPGAIDAIAAVMRRLIADQDDAILHLRSINRKLTALGVAATATHVQAPPTPSPAGTPNPRSSPSANACG